MTSWIFNVDSIGTGTRGPISAGDGAYVLPGVTVGSTDNTAIGGNDGLYKVTVAGRLIGDVAGIVLGDNATLDSTNRIDIRAGAEVFGYLSAGIVVGGWDTTITNRGYVYGFAVGISTFGSTANPSSSSIFNSGTIESDLAGVTRNGSEAFKLTNSGTIIGRNTSLEALSASGALTIVNSGQMVGDVALGSGNDLYDGRLGSVAGLVNGNDGADRLFGGNEANLLIGGAQLDYLAGGLGNDTYAINRTIDGAVTDTIVEALNAGIDTVNFTVSAAGQAYGLGANLERLTLLGNFASTGIGNTLANIIVGNTQANTIAGSLGLDVLTGDAGNDRFLFNTTPSAANVDRITDFAVPTDTIGLENAIFTAITGAAGANLGAAEFWKSTTGLAHDANDRIIYETDTGKIFYDSNGNAAGGAVLFAIVAPNLALTNLDFLII